MCAHANPGYSKMELAHAIKVSSASHILADASSMPIVVETLQHMGHSTDQIKQRVIIVESDSKMPPEYKASGGSGWMGLTTPL